MINHWLIVGMLAAFIATNTGAFFFGRDYEQGKQAKVQQDLAIAYANEIAARQSRVDALSADLEKAMAVKQGKDRVIIKEVVRYEQIVPAERRCVLDGTWRLLHDAAATGEITFAASVPYGAAEPVADAEALDTVAENYADCRDWRDQVIGWQRFWSEVSAPAKSTHRQQD